MAFIKKELAAKQDLLLSADNTGVQQTRNGQVVTVNPINASVIPYSDTESIMEAINSKLDISDNLFSQADQDKLDGIANNANNYTHPSKHPANIIDGSLNPSMFVKTDTLGNTGFDYATWAELQGKPASYTPSAHQHSMDEITTGNLSAVRITETIDKNFVTEVEKSKINTAEQLTNKGVPNGYVPLEADGKINSAYLASLNILDIFYANDEASMLLLNASLGDICYRNDTEATLMLTALPATTLSNWKVLNTIGVMSINGLQGVVSLVTTNIPEGTNKYYTNQRVVDLVKAGTNVTLVYDNINGTLTINANDTSIAWSEVTAKPTTITGYGITDAYTKTEVQTVLPKVGFDTTNTIAPTVAGQMAWNQADRTLDLCLNGVTLQIGQEEVTPVRNGTAITIPNRTVVMVTGSIGNSGILVVAPWDLVDAKYILGITTEDILAGEDGFTTREGRVRHTDTSMWSQGDVLYATVDGGLTNIEPITGVKVPLAFVVISHINGTLYVRRSNLDENKYELANTNIQNHIASVSNPHSVTKAQVGLSNVDNTSDANKPVSTATTNLLDTVNLTRADKYLAAQNISNMVYTNGNLTKIQYLASTDVNYETLGYTLGNLTTINHYVASVLKGTTTLSYTNGALTSAVFVGV